MICTRLTKEKKKKMGVYLPSTVKPALVTTSIKQ